MTTIKLPFGKELRVESLLSSLSGLYFIADKFANTCDQEITVTYRIFKTFNELVECFQTLVDEKSTECIGHRFSGILNNNYQYSVTYNCDHTNDICEIIMTSDLTQEELSIMDKKFAKYNE